MNIIRREPKEESGIPQSLWQLDKWLNFPTMLGAKNRLGGLMAPNFVLHEADDRFILKANWPQEKGSKVKVEAKNQLLTVKGEISRSVEKKEKDTYSSESLFQSFERNFPLPDNVNARKVRSNYHDGSLEIVLPKKVL